MKRDYRALIIAVIATFAVVALLCLFFGNGYSEELDTVWVLCQPDSYVNIRMRPSSRSESCGFAYCGDDFYTDGRKKLGFIHVFAPIEAGEGWISLGYIVWEEPERVYETRHIDSSGRVKARKTINGKRRMWLRDENEVRVYWMSDSWAVTDKGFVMSKYIGEW